MKTFDLVTIGNACIDIFTTAHAPPPPGGITELGCFNLVAGGNGANTAITARRCGVRTAFAGVLGDDLPGRLLRDILESEGVDASLLRLLPARSSPATLVYNDERGERSFAHHPGTNADFVLPDEALSTPCRVFHLAAPELLPGLWPAGAVEAARRLRAAGRTVTLDTFAVEGEAAVGEIERAHRPLLEHCDMVFPNEAEARLITGRRELRDVAARFHELGVRTVAIKRGERGAIVSWDGRFEDVPAEAVQVVDTCGAGDSFAAGFIAGHLGGLDPLECTRLGCALGTLCVRFQGSTTGSADPKRLEACLSRLGGLTRSPQAL
ncbi:MAG: carbohydrate kinase family protein [Planctomycetes bacterium]|nr:carbohydrate kinase family protein [Planctomycetota bacterium]